MKSSTGNYDEKEFFLPDFCDIRWVSGGVMLSVLLAFLLEIVSIHSEFGFQIDFGLRSLFILWIVLPSEAVLCATRRWLNQMPQRWASMVVFVLIQVVTILVSWSVNRWLPDQRFSHDAPRFDDSLLFYLPVFFVSAIITLALLRHLYVLQQWKIELKAETVARLEALQSRIRPHFLFNSLNTITNLIQTDPVMAEALVHDLAELFRASLSTDQNLVTLTQECALIQQYLQIEQQRLGRRLRVEWALDNLPQHVLVPPLSLQPLVENALYHGIEPAANGGTVWITGTMDGNKMILTIKNSLPSEAIPRVEGGRSRRGNQMAVENVRARIEGFFPDEGEVLCSEDGAYYQVSVTIPCQTMEDRAG